MNEALSTGVPQLVLRPFKVGALSFEVADKYDPSQKSLDMRARDNLKRQGYHTDYSGEAYRVAIKTRPAGTIGRGWTPEFLYQTGAMDRPSPKLEPEIEKPPEQTPAPLETQKAETPPFEPVDTDVAYQGYWLRPRVITGSHFVYYSIYSPDKELLQPKEAKSLKRAQEIVDAVLALGQPREPIPA